MPTGLGVNSYIDIDKQRFQTIDDAVTLISNNCYLAKVDLRHAYCSIPVHPDNYPALGLKWKFQGETTHTYLVDTRLPFGASSSAGIFHRITQSVKRMMLRRGHASLVVYLDDFLVVGESEAACQATYDELCSLLQELGFQLSVSKLVPPTQNLVFLGIEFDTVTMSLSLPADKLSDLKTFIHTFCLRHRVTKKQLQQLAGKLNWACKVVFGGRTFLRRVLDLMNSLKRPSSRCRLTSEFLKDMEWWSEFLVHFNGKRDFLDNRPVTSLYTDACSYGIGAWYEDDWIYSHLPVDYSWAKPLHINYKEALCVVLAAFQWGASWKNKTVIVRCDNTAAVGMLNKGTTKHPLMMTLLRRLFWLSATYNFRLKVYHIPGLTNVVADNVSRLHEADHFLSFYGFLFQKGFDAATVSAFSHMTKASYYFLLGHYLLLK